MSDPGSSAAQLGTAKETGSGKQRQPGPVAPSAERTDNPLDKLLAKREALCRELESTWGTAIDGVLVRSSGARSGTTAAGQPRQDTPVKNLSEPPAELLDRLRMIEEKLTASDTERNALASRFEQLSAENAQLRETCASQVKRIAELETALQEARTAAAQVPPPSSPSQSETSELAARCAELHANHEELVVAREKERRSHAEETASLTKQISELRQRYEAQIAGLLRQCDLQTDAVGMKDGREASNKSAPVAFSRPARNKPRPAPELLILDDSEIGEETAQRLKQFGHPAAAFSSKGDAAAELAEHNIVCLAVNLALPSSWRAVRALRSLHEHREAPVVAYALAQRADSGFWFGNVDFVVLPRENGSILSILRRVAPGARQVIAIGPDDGALAAARKSLVNARIAFNVAPDRKSALDLVRSAYPQAAFVYPTPNPVDGFRAIAAIRSLAIFRDIPSVFLLDEVAQPREDERISAGARTTLRLGRLTAANLVNLLVDALGTALSPVQPRAHRAPQSRA